MVLILLGASKVSANLYCNSRASVLGRLRDYYLRLLIKRSVYNIRTMGGTQFYIRGYFPEVGGDFFIRYDTEWNILYIKEEILGQKSTFLLFIWNIKRIISKFCTERTVLTFIT